MAEKNLNVRISLKYDSYANWTAEANQFVLKAGELACVELKATNADSNVAPTVLFKVGDGTRTFNQLDWASAKAADVHAWAKLENPEVDQLPLTLRNAIHRKAYIIAYREGTYANDTTADAQTHKYGHLTLAQKTLEAFFNDYYSGSATIGLENPGYLANLFLEYDHKLYPVLEAELTARPIKFTFEVPVDGVVKIATITATKAGSNFTNIQGKMEDKYLSELSDSANLAKVPTSEAVKTYVDEAIQAVKDYSDNNDTNTAHTHSVGAGLKQTGDGGIDGNVKYEVNVALKHENKTITLYDKADNTVLATLDSSEFVKDGMLDDVSYDAANNTLTFTWNTDAGKKTDTVELVDILDPYTAGAKIDISTDGVISHETVANPTESAGSGRKYLTGVTTDGYGHITGFTTASETDQDLSNYKTKQTAVTNKITNAAHVLSALAQDTNGNISYNVKVLTPADIGAQPAGSYKTTQTAVSDPTANGSTLAFIDTISQDANGVITATKKNVNLSNYKTKQTEVSDPTANGSTLTFIDTISQNANGVITATKKNVDLSDYATNDSIGDGTLTLTGNEGLTGSATFSANQEGNATFTVGIADGGVAKAKLNSTVQASLDKADSAVQSVKVLGETLSDGGELTVAEAKTALGLKSAAYTESTAYATAAQGELADSAVQSITIGTANGTISVDGVNVPVKGLGTAAYKADTAFDAAGTAAGLVNTLNVTDTAVTGKYVSAVSETNGKISVTRADLPTYTLTTGSTNGTVKFNNTDVAVKGLGSAAYTDSTAYATAAQGTKADNALQSISAGTGLKVSTKANNSQTIDIDETVVFVLDCGSATKLVD